MFRREFIRRVPGYIAISSLVFLTTLWILWGTGEMYYEGWWGSWQNRIPYFIPGVVFFVFTAISLTWPKIGGWFLIIIGGSTFLWWMDRVDFALERLFIGGMLGGFATLIGILFLLEAYFQKKLRTQEQAFPKSWLRRNLRYFIAFLPSLLTFVGVTAFFLPLAISRFDDGKKDARLIKGKGIELVWAPAGPGWSQGIGPSKKAGKLLEDANLSWNEIAFYGAVPVGFGEKPGYEDKNAREEDMKNTGLCGYLGEDGMALLAEPQNIWRMPTTDEIVRSLVRGGENAGCTWDGKSFEASCEKQPNKDSPLWDPSTSPIYYWSAEEYDEKSAWYVPYTGGGLYGGRITFQPKSWGNPRHGFRCVREPQQLSIFF